MKTLSFNALRLCIIDAVINMDIADIKHYTLLLEAAIEDIEKSASLPIKTTIQ